MLHTSCSYPFKIYQKWFCLYKIASKKKSAGLYKKCLSFSPLSSSPFLKLFHIVDNPQYKIDLLIKSLYVNPKDNIAYNYLYAIFKRSNLLKKSVIFFNIKDQQLDFELKIDKKQKDEIRRLDVFLSEHSLYSISLKLFYSSIRPGKIYSISNNGNIILDKENENKILDFILDKNNNLIIGSIHKHLSNLESFVHGAGRIKIVDNKIMYIDNWSGHYRPTLKEFYLTLRLLDKIGYNLSYCHALDYESLIRKEFIHKKNYTNAFYKNLKFY